MFYLKIILVAFLGGFLITYIARRVALQLGFVSKPNPIVPQHKKPIAYMGGAGIYAGLVAAATYVYFLNSTDGSVNSMILFDPSIIFGATAFLTLGIIDDLKVFGPKKKLFFQLAIGVTCIALGLEGTFTAIPAIDDTITLCWIIFMVNAANLVDVCDGLLSGIICVTFMSIGFFIPLLAPFCFLIAGSTLGFLCFNFPPASIFLGDAGSHLLGFFLSVVGIYYSQFLPPLDGVGWMLMISLVPIFEVSLLVAMRVKQKLPWWKGSPDHFSLRLQRIGFSKIRVNVLTWCLSFIITVAGCYFLKPDIAIKVVVCALIIILFLVSWRFVSKIQVSP